MLRLKARRAVAQRWVSARRAFGLNLTSTHRMIGYRWVFLEPRPTNDEQLSLFSRLSVTLRWTN
jgi:hypothetical protein